MKTFPANQVTDTAQLTAGNDYSLICLYLTLYILEQDLFLFFKSAQFMLLNFSCGQYVKFSDIMIQLIELACSALSSFVTLGISYS